MKMHENPHPAKTTCGAFQWEKITFTDLQLSDLPGRTGSSPCLCETSVFLQVAPLFPRFCATSRIPAGGTTASGRWHHCFKPYQNPMQNVPVVVESPVGEFPAAVRRLPCGGQPDAWLKGLKTARRFHKIPSNFGSCYHRENDISDLQFSNFPPVGHFSV